MNKLSALDAGFLYLESERAPQHIASVQVLELAEGVRADTFVAELKQLLASRAHLVPCFTMRLQATPFGLDHPEWVKDPTFDLENHVHTLAVAQPGGQEQLEATIARLHELRLDRSKPLWDLWVLTGLEGGRIAYYNRVHHACVDGVAGQRMIEAIMDTDPLPRVVEPAGTTPVPGGTGTAGLLIGALENLLKYQTRQPAAALASLDTAARLFRRAFDPGKGFGAAAEQAPVTRFNHAIGSKRVYAAGDLSIADLKSLARASHATLNDAFLAVCAGGLRRYFSRLGELPDKQLLAGCPVSLRRPNDSASNNQVTLMTVGLATDSADPLERLRRIARSARKAKALTLDLARSFDADVALPGLPTLLQGLARFAEASGAVNLPGQRPPFNLVISNVPGPRQPLYSNGARMLTHYPVSIPAHGQAVNITVQSYAGRLYFGITGCARALPDASILRDDLLGAGERLMAIGGQAVRAGTGSPSIIRKVRSGTARRSELANQAA
ncbi:MAG: wax ester/triacylglycerol synthase family O-acyltransferase [Pseudomonadales bacterium]